MSEERILDKINEEVVKITPDNYDEILSKAQNQIKDNIIEFKPKKNNFKKYLSLAAVFVLIICSVFAVNMRTNRVDSIIDIDVNPSIELSVNAEDKIVGINCLNKDAENVFDGVNFKGADLSTGIDGIIDLMYKKGYITEKNNAILVSVANKDEAKKADVLSKVGEQINTSLNTKEIKGCVLMQSFSSEDNIKLIAQKYDISEGKAQLIEYIFGANKETIYDELSKMSVSELALIVEKINSETTDENKVVSVINNENQNRYIGEEKAKNIVFADSNLSENTVYDLEAEIEYTDGKTVYEIKFKIGGFEYEYEVDVYNGEILKNEKEIDEDYYNHNEPDDAFKNNYISKDEAKTVALENAGLNENLISDYEIKLKKDSGKVIYEIKFKSGENKYEYKLDAENGEIILK